MIAIPSETETLARLLARKTGKTPEEVVREAVEASARALGVDERPAALAERATVLEAANAIALRSAARPVLDPRSEDEILGYDEHGLPQ